jgi:cobalt-zinc-cadmium efflux system protein
MGAGHDHASPGTPAPRLAIATALLGGFFVVELTTALLIGSISLLADAGHILTDVAATFMGLCAVILAQRGSTSPARTYGWHRAEVFTAVANAVLLIGVASLILREAIGRIGQAPDVPGIPMVAVALAGLATNVAVALLLRSNATQSLAVKGAYMEVVADMVGSVGVLIAGVVTITTHWPYADVVVAVLVALWVLPRALSLAAGALRILSESSPSHIDVWTLVPGKDMVTAHLASCDNSSRLLRDAQAVLAERGLDHATIQIELPDDVSDCAPSF